MNRIRCHTAMRVLAVPIALVITLADWLLIITTFPVLAVLSLLPDAATDGESNTEFPLLPIAIALVAAAAFIATHFLPWGFAK